MARGCCTEGRRLLGGCALPAALLVVLPKCPMCVAGYLAIAMGSGLAMPIAMHLRGALLLISGVLIGYGALRMVRQAMAWR
jgi:hypothetical protein